MRRVLGIDPGIAEGKPLPMVGVDPTELRVLGYSSTEVLKGDLWGRLLDAEQRLEAELELMHPELVVVEDARGVGGSAHALQTLVELICDWCEARGVEVLRVNPQTVKKHYGRQKHEIALAMSILLQGSDQLPDGEDWTDAAAIAMAGFVEWTEARL